jgi:hypothetical protein
MKKIISTVLALAAASVAVFALTGAKKTGADASCPDCATCDCPPACGGK